jgi:hypothetical protein
LVLNRLYALDFLLQTKIAARPTERRSGGQRRAHQRFLMLTMMVTMLSHPLVVHRSKIY